MRATWLTISSRFGSMRSAHTPAGSIKNSAGRPNTNTMKPCHASPRSSPSSTTQPYTNRRAFEAMKKVTPLIQNARNAGTASALVGSDGVVADGRVSATSPRFT